MKIRAIAVTAFFFLVVCSAAAFTHETTQLPKKIGLPVFPSATAKPETDADHRNVVVSPLHGSLIAESYVTRASLDEVLAYYSKELGRFGAVKRCNAGRNDRAVFRINGNHFSAVSTCDGAEFGRGNIELKSGRDHEQRVVIAERKGDRTEFTIVYVRVDGVTHELI